MNWILLTSLVGSVSLNIYFALIIKRIKCYENDREKDLRVMFNNLETEVRMTKNKLGISK